MGALQMRPECFDVYLDMAVEFGLPLRLSGASAERAAGFPFRRLAAEEGVLFPDSFIVVRTVGSRRTIERVIGDLRPGVTEVYLHPRSEEHTSELQSLMRISYAVFCLKKKQRSSPK